MCLENTTIRLESRNMQGKVVSENVSLAFHLLITKPKNVVTKPEFCATRAW